MNNTMTKFTGVTAGSISMIVGPRCSGASTLVCDLTNHLRATVYAIFYFCPHEYCYWYDDSHFYNAAQLANVYYHRSLDALDDIAAQLENRAALIKHTGQDNPNFLFVFDDVMTQRDWRWHTIQYLFRNRLSLHATIVFSANSFLDVYAPIRTLATHMFVLATNHEREIDQMYNAFRWAQLGTRNSFGAALDRCTRDHGCMVLTHQDGPHWYRASVKAREVFRRNTLWPLFRHTVVALLQRQVAPYVALDIVDFILADMMLTSFQEESTVNHYQKITCITALHGVARN
jgi:hypothetical protein